MKGKWNSMYGWGKIKIKIRIQFNTIILAPIEPIEPSTTTKSINLW